jgi:phosphoenolpyruvate carboxylase|tara:strand:+ start:8200 stop:10854 length:2655 start_codon:yes stop_codon:yes gene_type:complete
MPDQQHAPLRDNVRLLGGLLGDTLRDQVDESLLNRVEEIRTLAKQARSDGNWQPLLDVMSELPDSDLVPVARAFTHFLNYANIAEQHHRVRRRRDNRREIDVPSPLGTMAELLPRLLNNGHSADAIATAISQLRTELVLTAHPTEITRRTLLRKYNDINVILGQLDRPDLTLKDQQSQLKRLRRRIIAGWQTDEIRRNRPTPVDEAKWGFATIESTLWHALPEFLRDLDEQMLQHTGKRLPLDKAPVRLSSWMGGDRDGNPNVTARVTEEVLLLARWEAADLLLRDINELREDLSFGTCNSALREAVGDHHEPYRELLREVRQTLTNTREWAEATLNGEIFEGRIYQHDEELLQPLQLIYQSLLDCGMEAIAHGRLETILRRVACFGLTLMKLDIRQESTRHSDVISEVTHYLGIQINNKLYRDWSETEKQTFLINELKNRRPLIPKHFPASAEVQEVLDTFAVLALQPASALGAYIISMATYPSDILAVRLLQQEAGCLTPQRIAPLFETLDDLEGAADSIEQLLAIEWYRQDIDGQQEVMIGYSDSAKDAGFFAASWAQYRAQEALSGVCENAGVHLTLFHGRGGSVSRGGGPAHEALLSQPPGTIKGSVRVTEQGEMIQFKFGLKELAIHNLELYTTATLEATLSPIEKPKQEWREMMQTLADVSVKEYRRIVHHDPRFVDYFRCVTPEQELSRLSLGSRPAKRRASGGVESLRAIPWVFAWTQMRLMLPAWLGTGKALAEQIDQGQQDLLQVMLRDWNFFSMLLDMQEMVMAKADAKVAAYYEQRLLDNVNAQSLGQELQAGFQQAHQAIESISGHSLLANNPMLQFSIAVRNPYIDPLHITQVELMRRLRLQDQDNQEQLEQALMVSIAGIAAGLRNTG